MKIGMLGLQGAGKKTLFTLMTGSNVQTVSPKGVPGIFRVRDPRVDLLSDMYKPQKTNYAQMDVLLLPDVAKTEGKAAWLDDVRNLDGICCVVRAFDDPSVFHPAGSVDPVRDLETFLLELLFADVFFLEKRKEKLTSELRARKHPQKEKELEIITRLSGELEKGVTVRQAALSDMEKETMAASQFLTDKPIAAVINLTQDADTKALRAEIEKGYGDRMTLSFFDAKLESEIAAISDLAERKEFLEGLGIEEPAVDKLTRGVYEALGLMSYFTVGEDEVRAWTVRKGSSAPKAARAIHSDLERGFIRVEVIKYADLVGLGGEAQVKEAGKLSLKGKDYIVEEGDLLSFRTSS